jgi:DNA adenine methylase
MPLYKSKTKQDIKKNTKEEQADYYSCDLQPFIKWVGGKTQSLDDLMNKFPKRIKGNYYETFVGGGSVFIKLIKQIIDKKIQLDGDIYVNDINSNLINLYEFIKNEPTELLKKVKKYKTKYLHIEELADEPQYDDNGKKKRTDTKKFDNLSGKDIDTKEKYYYTKRNRYNSIKNNNNPQIKLERAALFVFLNKTCWRGVYRENSKGEFNVPFGNYETMSMYNERQIQSLSHCFKNLDNEVHFHNEDFKEFNKKIKSKKDFVYMDPPYFPATIKFKTVKVGINCKGYKVGEIAFSIDGDDNCDDGKLYTSNKKVFATYNKESFGLKQQTELLSICKGFRNKNIMFSLSNSYCTWIEKNYKNFTINKILSKRRINSKNPQDKDYEVLISN